MTAPIGAPGTQPPLIVLRCTQNTFYRRAIETTEYLQALELRDKAMQTRAELPTDSTPPLPPDIEFFDRWLASVPEFDKHAQAIAAKANALDSLIAQCNRTLSSHAMNVERAVAALATELPPIVAGITDAVGRLDGAHTPTDAITANKGAVWNELRTEHRPIFDAFWTAFDWLTAGQEIYFHARSDYLLDDDLASRARIRNIGSVFPAWKQPRPDTALQNWDRGDPRPWTKDPVGELVWLVTSGAELWAPTPSQLRAQTRPSLIGNEPLRESNEPIVLNEAPREKQGAEA